MPNFVRDCIGEHYVRLRSDRCGLELNTAIENFGVGSEACEWVCETESAWVVGGR